MKKTIILLLLALVLTGCINESPEITEEPTVVIKGEQGNYNHVVPFDSNKLRFHRPGANYKEIGQGLIHLSKEYFPISSNDLKEGDIVADYNQEFRPLIFLRESQENPVGLNPSRETKVKVNDKTEVTGPRFISDLFEINFVSSKNADKMTGAAFALVLNKTINGDDARQVVVDDKVLYEFATKIAGPKLESYLRKKPELSGVPIMIAIYVIDSSNQSVPGNYIAKAKFVNRQGQFEKVKHQWVLFPTNTGRSSDLVTNEHIVSMKRSLTGFIPEDIGVIAYGEYHNEKLSQLQIKINVQTKTYTEVLALSHYIGELLTTFDTGSKIVVEIKSLNDTLAIIKKDVGKSEVEVIML